jgi:hypothetical protein
MAKTKRVQALMEPEKFHVIEQLAMQRGSPVSDFMREAARAQFLSFAASTRGKSCRCKSHLIDTEPRVAVTAVRSFLPFSAR